LIKLRKQDHCLDYSDIIISATRIRWNA